MQGAEIDGYKRGHTENHFEDIGVLVLGDFDSRAANLWSPDTLNQNQKDSMEILSKWLCYYYDLPIDIVAEITPIKTHRSMPGSSTQCPGENMATWVENNLRVIINEWY